jgi:hypothetical protein
LNASSATASVAISALALTLMIVRLPNRPPVPTTVSVAVLGLASADALHGGTPPTWVTSVHVGLPVTMSPISMIST